MVVPVAPSSPVATFDRKAAKKRYLEAYENLTNILKRMPPKTKNGFMKDRPKDDSTEGNSKDQPPNKPVREKLTARQIKEILRSEPSVSRPREQPKIRDKNKVHLKETPKKISLAGKSVEELQKLYNEMKGKRKSYVDRLYQKGIKSRIKKKSLKEKRKLERENKTKNIEGKEDSDEMDTEENQEQDNEMIFNKLDFSEEDQVTKKQSNNDPKRALQKIEKTKNRIKELETTGRKEKASLIKNKQKWHNAIQRAEGVKVKDNVELLKKSIRKRDRSKRKSKQAWEERNNQVKTKMEEAQKKRKDNIMKKNQEKKQKKMKKAIKKGRVVL